MVGLKYRAEEKQIKSSTPASENKASSPGGLRISIVIAAGNDKVVPTLDQDPTVYLFSGGSSFPREDALLASGLRITTDEDETDPKVESCLTGASEIPNSPDAC